MVDEDNGKVLRDATLHTCGKRPLPPSRSGSDSTDAGAAPAASSSSKKSKKQKTARGKGGDLTAIELLTKMHEDNQAAERRHNELTHELVSAFTKNNERLVDLLAGSGPSANGKGKARAEDSDLDDVEEDGDDEGWRSSTDST